MKYCVSSVVGESVTFSDIVMLYEQVRTCRLYLNTVHIPSIINFYFRETGILESYVPENGNSRQKKRRNKKIGLSSILLFQLRCYNTIPNVSSSAAVNTAVIQLYFILSAFLQTSTFNRNGFNFWPSWR